MTDRKIPLSPAEGDAPSRRSLFGTGAALALVGLAAVSAAAAVRATTGDEELIRLCGEFDALQHRIDAFYSEGATPIKDDAARDEMADPLKDEQHELLPRICALRATTLDGHRARARSLLLWDKEIHFESAEVEDEYLNTRIIAALLRDLTAGA